MTNVVVELGVAPVVLSVSEKEAALDQAFVVARALRAFTSLDVDVRLTGSAATATVACMGNTQLSVSAGWTTSIGLRPPDEDLREWRRRRDEAPRVLLYDVLAAEEWLIDGTEATGPFGSEFTNPDFPSLEEAIKWLHSHCRQKPSPRVSPQELARWARLRVSLRDPLKRGKRTVVSLREAVELFGAKYGAKIRTATLQELHGLTVDEAATIEAAVRLCLPRKR